MSWSEAPRYVLSGVRALSVVLPLQLALMALTWAMGAFRYLRDLLHKWNTASSAAPPTAHALSDTVKQ